jgi:hypothetical protein
VLQLRPADHDHGILRTPIPPRRWNDLSPDNDDHVTADDDSITNHASSAKTSRILKNALPIGVEIDVVGDTH